MNTVGVAHKVTGELYDPTTLWEGSTPTDTKLWGDRFEKYYAKSARLSVGSSYGSSLALSSSMRW